MALSTEDLLKVSQVLSVPKSSLDDWLLAFALSSDAQTAIEAELTLWDTAATNFTAIEPKERNFGARINPNDARNAIRRNIAILLERPEWGMTGSRLVRC